MKRQWNSCPCWQIEVVLFSIADCGKEPAELSVLPHEAHTPLGGCSLAPMTALSLCASLPILGLSAASGQWPSSLNGRGLASCSTRTAKSRSPTRYMLSILMCNLGRSLVWQQGRWPGCQKTGTPRVSWDANRPR